MKISALEQSLVRNGGTAGEALQDSLALARAVEAMGYHRLWVSEHHDSHYIAGSSPEVLLAALGGVTSRIRLGSGGIMLPHYSAYKVAENFALLSNLYPGRIDLGVGRAPGADMKTAIALATDGRPKFERFPELVDTLLRALNDPSFSPTVSPSPVLPLPVWILGSSPDSALLAAKMGLPYAVALFINPHFDPGLIELYRRHYQPSALHPQPYVMIAMHVFASDRAEHAHAMSHAAKLSFLRFVTGRTVGTIAPEEAAQVRFDLEEQAFISRIAAGSLVGTGDDVAEAARSRLKHYQADEFMMVCNSFHFQDRIRSFELFARHMEATVADGLAA